VANDRGETYNFETIENAEIKINSFLSQEIIINGEDEINKPTAYTISVLPENTSAIRLTATHKGSLKTTDGTKSFISNVAKPIGLSEDKTVLELIYSCDGYVDNIYTITFMKFDGIKTGVSEDGKTFTVSEMNIESGKTVVLALYDEDRLVETKSATYEGDELIFTTDKAYTNAKVMVFDSLFGLKPLCDAEDISQIDL